jgi:hypothetical protein
MKIIDKTPLQDANGNINIIARVQGTLKYGLSWFGELEAQKTVIAQLDRSLEKGFVLIRNFTLPNSEIVIPIVLIGAGGISVIYVTKEKGNFEAKGDQWNTVNNDGKALPASINFIDRASKLGIVLQKYLKIKKVEMPNPVEAVLIAADPGAQIESVRPIVRVVRSDAIKQFANSLLQARPVWRTDFIHEIAERIIDARGPEELQPVVPAPASQQTISRANALAQAAEQGTSFNANELGFALEESGDQPASQNLGASSVDSPARPQQRSKPAPAKKKFLGLKDTQIIILAGMFIIGICAVFGLAIILYLNL